MFIKIKELITDLAYAAVNISEETLSTATGQEKKAAAIEYIVSMIPIFSPLKPILIVLLSKFIDEAIEKAVEYMKSVKNPEV